MWRQALTTRLHQLYFASSHFYQTSWLNLGSCNCWERPRLSLNQPESEDRSGRGSGRRSRRCRRPVLKVWVGAASGRQAAGNSVFDTSSESFHYGKAVSGFRSSCYYCCQGSGVESLKPIKVELWSLRILQEAKRQCLLCFSATRDQGAHLPRGQSWRMQVPSFDLTAGRRITRLLLPGLLPGAADE